MAMKVSTFNGVKVYNLSSGKAMPQWLTENQKRKLAKDEEYRKRVDIIQDFEVNTAAQRVKITADGEHVLVAGTYPPCFRCYTLSDLSLKFHRGLTAEVVDFVSLSADYSKVAFLLNDRSINFHAAYGTHYATRVPKFGRDLKYGWDSCDLFVSSSGDEIYRLNLEAGQFREPFKLGFEGCNKMHINPQNQLLACGGERASCEFIDTRYRKSVARIHVSKDESIEVTALKFDVDGLTLAVGTSNGQCILYDIRSNRPMYVKEHQYELPIIDVSFHESSKHVISSDKKVMKIWERENMGKILTNIETPCDLNDVHLVNDKRGSTGMIFAAGEQSRLMTYFIPQLGPAPRWCSFLENITEELEETSGNTVYEDYKFLTESEVKEIGATGLIGTDMLKGYMHGYFMNMKLYQDMKQLSKPYDYEEHRKKLIQDKLKKKAESHIGPRSRVKKNQSMQNSTAAADDRFKALFERDEFLVDQQSEDFKLRNPTQSKYQRAMYGDEDDDENDYLQGKSMQNNATNNGGRDDDDEDSYDSDDDDEDDDGDKGVFRRVLGSAEDDVEDDDEEDDNFHANKKKKTETKQSKKSAPKMFEATQNLSKILTMSEKDKKQLKAEQRVSLGKRASQLPSRSKSSAPKGKADNGVKVVRTGDGVVREMTFTPSERKLKRGEMLIRDKRRREEEESFATINSRFNR